jgi:hypothetical protein
MIGHTIFFTLNVGTFVNSLASQAYDEQEDKPVFMYQHVTAIVKMVGIGLMCGFSNFSFNRRSQMFFYLIVVTVLNGCMPFYPWTAILVYALNEGFGRPLFLLYQIEVCTSSVYGAVEMASTFIESALSKLPLQEFSKSQNETVLTAVWIGFTGASFL